MALIKSLIAGGVASLAVANLMHEDGSVESGALGIVETTVRDQRIAWSWTVFAIVTIGVWLLFKAVNNSR